MVDNSTRSLELTGALTLETVPAIHERFKAASLRGELPDRIDLSAIDRADTSALALLLEIESWVRAASGTIQWSAPPETLRVLADLSQASELLNWNDKEPN